MPSICFTCKETTECKKCSKCQLIKYCSVRCQKTDWQEHKLKCADYQILCIYLIEKEAVETPDYEYYDSVADEAEMNGDNDLDTLDDNATILTEPETVNSEEDHEPPELILPPQSHPFMSESSDYDDDSDV